MPICQGFSAVGQKGMWEGGSHRAVFIGSKITHFEPLRTDVKQYLSCLLGLCVKKPSSSFGIAASSVYTADCRELFGTLFPYHAACTGFSAPSTLQHLYGYKPAAPTLKSIFMNLALFCEWF